LKGKAHNNELISYTEQPVYTGSRGIPGKVLYEIAEECHSRNEPILSSIVRNKNTAKIGNGWEDVMKNFNAADADTEAKKCFKYY
jgi:hypothetical protein